jgi:hypothetical protein
MAHQLGAAQGWDLASPWNSIAGDLSCSGSLDSAAHHAPHNRAAALAVLGCAGDREAVAAAVFRRATEELEAAFLQTGACAAVSAV